MRISVFTDVAHATVRPPASGGTVDQALDQEVPAELETEHWCDIRFRVPSLVRAAFEEARDLHDAVEGGGTSLSAFIEALVAEATTTAESEFELDTRRPRRHEIEDLAAREARLDAARSRSSSQEEAKPLTPALQRALAIVDEVSRLCTLEAESCADSEERIRSIVRLESEVERRLAELLAEMSDNRGWRELGFSGVGHYGEERLGLSRTTAEDRVRLARGLRNLPAVRDAYERDGLGAEAASLVRRILRGGPPDIESESFWVEHACAVTIKRLRDELRLVDRERAWGAVDLCEKPPDDETWHRSLVRRPGMALDRVRRAGVGLMPRIFASKDLICMKLPPDLAASLLGAVESRKESLEDLASPEAGEGRGVREPASGVLPSILAARMFSMSTVRVPDWVGLLALIEDFVMTWDDPRGVTKRQGDKVYERDGWRCSAPGCTSRRNLEVHHVRYRSRGGSHGLSNRTCLCRFHHQQGEHGGLATCRGWAPLGLTWTLGEGGKGGRYRNERAL